MVSYRLYISFFLALIFSSNLNANTQCSGKKALEKFMEVHEKLRANIVTETDPDIDFEFITEQSELPIAEQLSEMVSYHKAIRKIHSYRVRCRPNYLVLDFVISDSNEALVRLSATLKQRNGKWQHVFSEKIPRKIAKWFDERYQSISQYVPISVQN